MESFITILYDFEKQWLSSFAGKAIVCTTKVYLFSKRGMKLFRMRKKRKDKDLIWHVVGEMAKKW